MDTGNVSHMAYGARIRKVQMTRGNRQGNNAFLDYQDNRQTPLNYANNETFLKFIFTYSSTKPSTLESIFKLFPGFESTLNSNFFEAVRCGNRKLAAHIVKKLL